MSITVIATDNETGERLEQTIEPGNYAVIAVMPCHLANVQHHANGTTVLTLKGRGPDLLGTRRVETTRESENHE